MSYFEKFLKTNQAYADLHGTAHLPQKPKTHVAIVTCMDSRLHVAHALGLALGDAHILRNAGGRVTDDTIRSLVISEQQLKGLNNDAFADQLARDLGVSVHGKDFLPFSDVEESVREDVKKLSESPLIPDDIVISGAVYDVDTGRISEVTL